MTLEELLEAVGQAADGRPYSAHRTVYNYNGNGGGCGEGWIVCVHKRGGTDVLAHAMASSPELALIDVCAQLERGGAAP